MFSTFMNAITNLNLLLNFRDWFLSKSYLGTKRSFTKKVGTQITVMVHSLEVMFAKNCFIIQSGSTSYGFYENTERLSVFNLTNCDSTRTMKS
jgi:hypothetical protein